MAGTVVPLLTDIHLCNAVDDWTGTPTLDTEVYIQGTGALSKKVSKTTSTHIKPVTNVDLSDTIIYVWVLGGSISQFDTKENGGIRIRVEEGATPNWGEWYVAGKDEGYEGGWQCIAIRTTQPFTYKSDPAPDMSSIDGVGVVFNVTASAAKFNCWWDAVRYGTGLRIKGGTEAEPGTFGDVVTAEETVANRWGIVTRSEGVLMVQGQLIFGSTVGGESTYFKDTSKIIIFRDRAFGVFYEIKIEGNATATTKVFFGAKSGDKGISGCIFSCAGTSKYKVMATDINITEMGFYGCTFLDADTISSPTHAVQVLNLLAAGYTDCVVSDVGKQVQDDTIEIGPLLAYDNTLRKWWIKSTLTVADTSVMTITGGTGAGTADGASVHGIEVLSCTFEACAEVLADNCITQYCNFISADDRGVRINNNSHNVTDCNFIACTHGVNIPYVGDITITFDALIFSGCTDDIEKSGASGALTIENTNDSNASTYDITGGGTVNIETSVYLKVYVKDEGGNNITDAQVGIFRQDNMDPLMNEDTVDGYAEETFNYGGGPDVDIYLRIRKSSTGATKYVPISTIGIITSNGFTYYAVLIEDKIAEP